ncbi:MAG: hypothetical protein ACD_37C00118G0003 [uncultured bacterium]|nr:MAG: hypothetical protein ACD_37C00118G0003 [uncultured bacterium]
MLNLKTKIEKPFESIIFQNEESLKNEKDRNQLDDLAEMTENRLYKLTAVFPFDFFPNQIYIEEKQIIIIYKQFFFTSQDYHILIEDILMPIVETSLFFATLKIEMGPGGFQQNPPPIQFLRKKQALRAKRIIVGLLVCHKEKINLSSFNNKELLGKLEEIGRFRSD